MRIAHAVERESVGRRTVARALWSFDKLRTSGRAQAAAPFALSLSKG